MKDTKQFKLFQGKSVNIIMKNIKGSQVLADGSVVNGSVVISGILFEEDDIYYYLGNDSGEINDSVLREDVLRMFVGPVDGEEFMDMETEGEMQ